MVISKLVRFGRRKLHTIISRDIIKPSSPTPSHSKTYNLSLLDQVSVNAYIPAVAFYQSSSVYQNTHDLTLMLKKSLSKTLTQYYPFAGRMKKMSPTYVDCNDEGVDFIEAYNDTSLSDFLQHSEHKDLDQLFPDDLVWHNSNNKGGRIDENSIACPLKVQVNHFVCGGVAVATSLFHKIGDGSTILNFVNHWATVTAQSDQNKASPINPHFIHYERNTKLPEIPDREHGDCVTKRFLFPNSKIHDLKAKVIAMTLASGQPIMNPTRVEVLTWLLHKCAIAAATKTTNLGTFKKTGIFQLMNMRNYLVETLRETSVGNFILPIQIPTSNPSDLMPNIFIGQHKKRKTEFQNITSLDSVNRLIMEICSEKNLDDYYIFSSVCGFPSYAIDFGWGKPVKVTYGGPVKNFIIFMNTPNDDGIEVLLSLEIQAMKIFQNDPELLAFC